MTTQKIWGQDYEQTVLDFTERNPDPKRLGKRAAHRTKAQRMRDAI